MRSFIITAILLLTTCILITINISYIKNTAAHIESLVSDESFGTRGQEAIEELEEFWMRNNPFVGLSVGYKETDRMSDLILDLKSYYELGNADEVKRIRALIVEACDELSRLERLNIENIL